MKTPYDPEPSPESEKLNVYNKQLRDLVTEIVKFSVEELKILPSKIHYDLVGEVQFAIISQMIKGRSEYVENSKQVKAKS